MVLIYFCYFFPDFDTCAYNTSVITRNYQPGIKAPDFREHIDGVDAQREHIRNERETERGEETIICNRNREEKG